MKIDFQDKVVLVTGATKGMGKQFADDFARLGATLILTGTDKNEIANLNNDAQKDKVVSRKYYAVDFTSQESTKAFLDVIESYKRIDACINNAGINKINFIEDTSPEDWRSIRQVNLDGPFLISKSVGKIMKKNNYGRIINIASIFGVISKAKRSAYTASKYGLRGLTITSAIEYAPYNVLVNSVSPGFVLTDLTKNILSKKEMNHLAAQVPLGRFARPEEISSIVLFLASSLNTYLTGQNIIVDGGFVNV